MGGEVSVDDNSGSSNEDAGGRNMAWLSEEDNKERQMVMMWRSQPSHQLKSLSLRQRMETVRQTTMTPKL